MAYGVEVAADAVTLYLIAYAATVAALVAVLACALPAGEPE